LGNEALKTCFHNSSLHKHNNLRKQTTTDQKQVSRGATSRRVPLDAQKKSRTQSLLFLKCLSLPDHRTFIEDYLKILDFIEWLKEYYPDKVPQLSHRK
jgi:hypothetical protein